MRLLYLHGFRTESSHDKIKQLRTMFPLWDVDELKYNPHDPTDAVDLIHNYLTPLLEANEEVMVIGTSLGGFWARYITWEYPVTGVLINPSFHPDKTLSVGEYKCHDTGRVIHVTEDMLNEFNKYKHDGYQYITALAMNDEVLDANKTLAELKKYNRTAFTFDDGGHRFANLMPLRKEILKLHNTLVI